MDYRNYIGCFLVLVAGLAAFNGDTPLAVVCLGVAFFAAVSLLHDHWWED